MIIILWSIFYKFIRQEWKYLVIIGMIGLLYVMIYNHGYSTCENNIAIAKQKATEAAQMLAGQEKQKIQEDNKKEIQKHLTLEKELTDELNKKIYTDCVLPSNGVRALNRFGQ